MNRIKILVLCSATHRVEISLPLFSIAGLIMRVRSDLDPDWNEVPKFVYHQRLQKKM